jgi:hypothetical protein
MNQCPQYQILVLLLTVIVAFKSLYHLRSKYTLKCITKAFRAGKNLKPILFVCNIRYILRLNFLMTISSPPPPSMAHFLCLPCQICGSERAFPREGIIHAMQTHQKGTVSLGEAIHDPQFWKEINYRLNRPKIDNVRV